MWLLPVYIRRDIDTILLSKLFFHITFRECNGRFICKPLTWWQSDEVNWWRSHLFILTVHKWNLISRFGTATQVFPSSSVKVSIRLTASCVSISLRTTPGLLHQLPVDWWWYVIRNTRVLKFELECVSLFGSSGLTLMVQTKVKLPSNPSYTPQNTHTHKPF